MARNSVDGRSMGPVGGIGFVLLRHKYACYEPCRAARRPLAAKLGVAGFLVPLLLPLSLCLLVSYTLRAERNLNRYLHDYD